MLDLRKCERSILCQFRTGVLHIETGRHTGLPADQRLCSFCTTTESDIEDEKHFALIVICITTYVNMNSVTYSVKSHRV